MGRIHFFSVFDFLASLSELSFVIDGELSDEEFFIGEFMLQVRYVVLWDFLDNVVVGERFSLLKNSLLVLTHGFDFII